jgi:hypothetical protein
VEFWVKGTLENVVCYNAIENKNRQIQTPLRNISTLTPASSSASSIGPLKSGSQDGKLS